MEVFDGKFSVSDDSLKKNSKFKEKNNLKINFNFSENKFIFYYSLFYSFGLFLGTYFYKIAETENLNKLIPLKDGTLLNLFISNLSFSLLIFMIVAFLGFNLLSNSIINFFPTIVGIAIGLRLGYYFLNFGVNGVGYTLLMTIPYSTLFSTALAFTHKVSIDLSTEIKSRAKGELNDDFYYKPFIIKYLILGIIIIFSSFLQAAIVKLFFNVVTI